MLLIIIILQSLTLVKNADRPVTTNLLTCSQKTQIRLDCKNMPESEIMNYSLKQTADWLTFSTKNNINQGKANCVGYARLCSDVYNYASMINRYSSKAKPVVGYVELFGVNINNIVKYLSPTKKWKNFVKDHDFVQFNINGKIYYDDPMLYE